MATVKAGFPLVEMTGIGKSFSGVAVLQDVNFTLEKGEIVSLLGANGAGKSTLVKILTGSYARDCGHIRFEGRVVEMASPGDAIKLGISFLPQEISLVPQMSVAENICLGVMTKLTPGLLSNRTAMEKKATEILDKIGFGSIDVTIPVQHISVAEQRVVEIARALSGQAQVIVLDEPTAALSEKDSELIFKLLRQMSANGISIVYISHYLREVFDISDRIEVLRNGQNVKSFCVGARETTVEAVLLAMLGTVATPTFQRPPRGAGRTETRLRIENLGWKNKINDISLELCEGEILGVFGLVGSGVNLVGRVLAGVQEGPIRGTLSICGKPYVPKNPKAAKSAGLGLVPADRKSEGILADLSVSQNIVAAFWPDYGKGLWASREVENAQGRKWICNLGIKTTSPNQPIRFLSGGNQQKACIARWLHESVKILILEEPTRGVDVGARHDIYAELSRLSDQGLSIIILSSDAEEVSGLCDNVLVLDRGTIAKRFCGRVDVTTLLETTAQPARSVGNRSLLPRRPT